MLSLLFAATLLVQTAEPPPQTGPPPTPENLRFQAPPEGFASPTDWSGHDVRFTEWTLTEGSGLTYLRARGVCPAQGDCTVDGRFEHSVGPDKNAPPTQHCDQYALAGPSGRLEVFAHQFAGKPFSFYRRVGNSWLTIGPGHAELEAVSVFRAFLSERAHAIMLQQQGQPQQ